MDIVLIKSYAEKPWRSPGTYQLIESSLQEKWRVHSINTKNPLTLFSFIRKFQWEYRRRVFVFNIAEYLDENNKSIFLPSLLDEMDVPHLGSGADTVEIGLDKAAIKACLLRNGVPTPRFFIVDNQKTDTRESIKQIGFPLIVKPVREGGHIGIRGDSIVYDDIGLNKVTNRIFDEYNQPALVEEYISGPGMREFSVGIIDGKARLFTPIEIDFYAMNSGQQILSYETAQKDLERVKRVWAGEIHDKIIDLAEKTFDIVSARDYSRVDLRMNDTGCYVLEINIMPGLGPNSFLPQAAKDIYGLEYNQMIIKLAENSIQRQRKKQSSRNQGGGD